MIKAISLLLAALTFLPGAATISIDPPDSDIIAPYYIVVDADDPSIVYYERDPDEQCIPASTMKIMTCILTLEHVQDLNETIEVTKQAAGMKDSNSLLHVYAGEILTVDQLLHGLMMVSGNDCALLLANYIAGSVEAYAEMANAKAAELGMTNTHFLNASGAFRGGQYSTARDMATLMSYALKNDKFRELISTVTYTVEPNNKRKKADELENSNRLISDDPETSDVYTPLCIGGKTGNTPNGGMCLVSAGELDGARVVVVLLGADDLTSYDMHRRMPRVFANAKFLMEYTLKNDYVAVTPELLGYSYTTRITPEGSADAFPVSAQFDADQVARMTKAQSEQLTADLSQIQVATEFVDDVSDAKAGDTVGTISCSLEGRALFTGNLVADTDARPSPTPTAAMIEVTPEPVTVPEPSHSPSLAGIGVYIFGGLSALLTISLIALIVLYIRKRRR